MNTTQKTRIPYHAAKFLGKYEPEIRERICCALRETMAAKGSEVLTWDELQAAIGSAMSEFRAVDVISPSPRMERLSLEAHQRGDFLSSKDYVNELRAELASSCKAED